LQSYKARKQELYQQNNVLAMAGKPPSEKELKKNAEIQKLTQEARRKHNLPETEIVIEGDELWQSASDLVGDRLQDNGNRTHGGDPELCARLRCMPSLSFWDLRLPSADASAWQDKIPFRKVTNISKGTLSVEIVADGKKVPHAPFVMLTLRFSQHSFRVVSPDSAYAILMYASGFRPDIRPAHRNSQVSVEEPCSG
jgi:hypothetical protein